MCPEWVRETLQRIQAHRFVHKKILYTTLARIYFFDRCSTFFYEMIALCDNNVHIGYIYNASCIYIIYFYELPVGESEYIMFETTGSL